MQNLLKTEFHRLKDTEKAPSGIILFAKQPGKTSFSSLFTVKHALNTKKVGHTGTLDCFAQGLMVVLSEGMTRLVPYITAFDKTYEAIITFGAETDTLDYTGTVIRTAPLPEAAALTSAVSRFRGQLDQKPPLFSAIHVDGKRASDIARKGGSVEIPARKVSVYSSEIIEMQNENGEIIHPFDLYAAGELVKYAHVRFHVSKGTYIRCLARDIAEVCDSAACLAGLLRTQVGSFRLEDAAGTSLLNKFTITSVLAENEEIAVEKERRLAERAAQENTNQKPPAVNDENELKLQQEVREKTQKMSPSVAKECGLVPVLLKTVFEKTFFNGRPLQEKMFDKIEKGENKKEKEKIEEIERKDRIEKVKDKDGIKSNNPDETGPYAVFTEDNHFAGVISRKEDRLSYQYVVPRPEKKNESEGKKCPEINCDAENEGQKINTLSPKNKAVMRIFSWDEILNAYKGMNPEVKEYFKDGSALTIGGFDGPHAGHMKLFDAVRDYTEKKQYENGSRLKKGVVTFSRPPHSVSSPNLFSGDISTLALKLDLFALKEFDFVIVIDFSSDFSRMKGNDFLSILKDCCSMQFAAAGCDFRCGHQLDTGVAELSAFARQNDFQFQIIDDVTYKGTRISSSLIRTCVQTGRLHEAEMLLGRPYTIDLRNVQGLIRNDVHCLFQIANGDVLQIVPPDGTYTVKATSAGARTCDTVLHVDSSLLRLEIPPEWSSTGIEKIEFTSLVS